MCSNSFVAHPTPLTLPRVEKLTQKRGKKLSSILEMFRVEEDELVASGTEVTRTTGQVGSNIVCLYPIRYDNLRRN